jgi:formylglycine-generating enzyme required for sulfatase activity
MSGNVREWCWDWINDPGPETVTDPTGTTQITYRAIQHGDWDETAPWCAVSIKDGTNPNGLGNPDKKGAGHVGFRVVCR